MSRSMTFVLALLAGAFAPAGAETAGQLFPPPPLAPLVMTAVDGLLHVFSAEHSGVFNGHRITLPGPRLPRQWSKIRAPCPRPISTPSAMSPRGPAIRWRGPSCSSSMAARVPPRCSCTSGPWGPGSFAIALRRAPRTPQHRSSTTPRVRSLWPTWCSSIPRTPAGAIRCPASLPSSFTPSMVTPTR